MRPVACTDDPAKARQRVEILRNCLRVAAVNAAVRTVRTAEDLLAYEYHQIFRYEQTQSVLQQHSWFQEGPVVLFEVTTQTSFC